MTTDVLTEVESTRPRGGTALAVLDILIVIAVSAAAYLLEGWARNLGLVALGDDSRGVSGVLLGAATALWLVRRRGGTLADLGFKRPRRWWTAPFWVLGILVAYATLQALVPAVLSMFIELPAPDLSRHNAIAGDLGAALLMALVLPFTASIPEEIIYRGFLIDRLTSIFGSTGGGVVLTVLVQSLLFGSVHFGWGLGGMIMTTIMGAVWATAFLLCGRNLWIVIIAHSVGHLLLVAQLYSAAPA